MGPPCLGYYRTTDRSVRVRSGASLSSAPLCDIPAGVVVRVDAIKLDGGRERARVAEPGAYEGWCSLSERLLTFVGAAVDGRYERHHLRGYRGAAAYKKVGSAMTLYRWRQKMWILADLGPGLSKFGEPHAWYTAPCGSPPEATPVTSAKWARACADGDLPPFVEVRGPVIQVEESGSDGGTTSGAAAPRSAPRPPPLAAAPPPAPGGAAPPPGADDPRRRGLTRRPSRPRSRAQAAAAEPASPSFVMVSPPASPSRTDFEVVDKSSLESEPFGDPGEPGGAGGSRCHVQ
ncbi:hypothetical protein JL722_4114 [Aureococcus anophagefferens]|nr:hypothetical protein JL722_4114 [Aureococcus anophagefferens]